MAARAEDQAPGVKRARAAGAEEGGRRGSWVAWRGLKGDKPLGMRTRWPRRLGFLQRAHRQAGGSLSADRGLLWRALYRAPHSPQTNERAVEGAKQHGRDAGMRPSPSPVGGVALLRAADLWSLGGVRVGRGAAADSKRCARGLRPSAWSVKNLCEVRVEHRGAASSEQAPQGRGRSMGRVVGRQPSRQLDSSRGAECKFKMRRAIGYKIHCGSRQIAQYDGIQ